MAFRPARDHIVSLSRAHHRQRAHRLDSPRVLHQIHRLDNQHSTCAKQTIMGAIWRQRIVLLLGRGLSVRVGLGFTDRSDVLPQQVALRRRAFLLQTQHQHQQTNRLVNPRFDRPPFQPDSPRIDQPPLRPDFQPCDPPKFQPSTLVSVEATVVMEHPPSVLRTEQHTSACVELASPVLVAQRAPVRGAWPRLLRQHARLTLPH